MRVPRTLLLCGVVCLSMAARAANVSGAAEAGMPPRPHVVFVVADDLGYADLGFMGAKDIRTPQLDTLAAGGAILDSFYGGPSPGKITDNGPLRAGKGTIYEGGVRVCAFAHWPNQIKPGTRVTEPIHIVDWFPTLVTLAGGSLEQKLPLDGLNVWDTIAHGATSPHDAILLCSSPSRAAVRAGDWKLVLTAAGQDAEQSAEESEQPAAKRKRGKKVQTAKSATEQLQLYNLATDIGEQHDRAADEPQRVTELRARLAQFLNDAVRPGNVQ